MGAIFVNNFRDDIEGEAERVFVELETASALDRNIPAVPVLVHGARMPRHEQLPADLRNLAYRNACELTQARWATNVQLLLRALRHMLIETRRSLLKQS